MLRKISGLERIARAPKIRRLLYTPFKYIFAIIFSKVVYRLSGKTLKLSARLFWDDQVQIALPASMDLFLLGCKTDDSEIRLTKFMLTHLHEGDCFVDIGSHMGYYSLLSSFCVGEKGRVLSVEASPVSFCLLEKNISKHINIEAFNIALSDKEQTIDLFEFPGQYAEYNTIEPGQFEGEHWFGHVKHKKTAVNAMRGDKLMEGYTVAAMIKIDVEGSENRVVNGLAGYLSKNDIVVVMEFVSEQRSNKNHILADILLSELGYNAFRILPGGEPERISVSTNRYVDSTGLASDNIVYKKDFM